MRKIKRKIMVDNWSLGEHESWFSDMAKEGWHLKTFGALFVHFERGEPEDTQYRIDTSSNKKMSAADKEMFQEAGWYHVTKLGEFNVFSSLMELRAPELHSDPAEQAYTLENLARRMKRNTIFASIIGTLSLALMISLWFIDKTPTLRFVTGDFMSAVSILFLITAMFGALLVNLSIHALRKKLMEGIPINHHAPWRKKRRLILAVHGFFILLFCVSIPMQWVQIALGKSHTLPIESSDLPIVRLADIEQNPDLVREEHFVRNELDMLNQYSFNWSPLAPLQYESDESGIVPGQLWRDLSGTYSPGLRTEVYRLNFPSLSEKLLADLVRRYIYEGEAMELESDVFDSLFIHEEEGSKDIFAAKGKGIIYVAYYGYADTAIILQQIEEQLALIEK
ncbi:DUF2812 domain-containing protein [Sporosarcina sp. NPDC096371]|uniref:DUF2812 domain-containing protein n=1 Tax=Sporosarcina sp. NPDC096371 TaxID=3364530 RepID=UPI0037FD5776